VTTHATPAPPALPLRPLGATGLTVSPLCIGCAQFGDMRDTYYPVAEDRALATIRAIFDGPVNFADTAAAYGDGESERRIGMVLRERGGLPEGFVLATKADRDLQTGDFSGDQIRRSIERSLRLLGLDQLQLVYLHDPEHIMFEEATAPGGPVDALRRCKEEGLIAHLGVAGGPIDLEQRFVETGAFEVVLSHNRYTLLNVAADPLWDLASRRGVAAVNAAPYGSGILAKGPAAYPRYAYQDVSSALLERARRIEDLCAFHDVPLAAAALQFSLRDPRIVSTVVGLTHPERLAETVDLALFPIPDGLWEDLMTVAPATDDPEATRWSH